MKKNFAICAAIAIIALTAAPYFAFAAHNPIKSNVFDPTILNGPLLICSGTNDAMGNTCSDLCDLVLQIANIIYFMIAVVIWIITPITIAIGGIMIMLGGANPGMIETGKKSITGAVWGVLIVLCAYLLILTFVKFMGITGIGGFGAASCSV